jgi:hypothetical protein
MQNPSRALREDSYHMNTTILNAPLVQLRPLVSARTLHLLTRNGFEKIADVQLALGLGTLGDLRGLGPVALMEIRLALDELPREAAGGMAPEGTPGKTDALTDRELRVILALAESGMSEDDFAGTCSWDEAHAALKHLRLVAGGERTDTTLHAPADWPQRQQSREPENPDLAEHPLPRLPEPPAAGIPVTPPPQRAEPEPVDDNFEGYVIDPKPDWGRF